MNTFYNDARVTESIWTDNDTEVIVVKRSYRAAPPMSRSHSPTRVRIWAPRLL